MKKVLFLSFVVLVAPVFVLAAGTIEINTATLLQLEEITGIGPALARRIVDARPFSSLDDLLKVKGIGEKTLQKIKDQGLTYVISNSQLPISNNAPVVAPTPVVVEQPTAITYQSGVVISEVLPAPEGADDTSEWVELRNTNANTVDISGWKLQDTQGTPATYIFPPNTVLAGGVYATAERPDTKITLNNDEDGLNLISPDGNIIDSMSYDKAPAGQSYSKTASGWQWSTTKTPNSANIITAPTTAKKTTKALSSSKKTDNTYLAATSGSPNIDPTLFDTALNQENASSPWLLFLVALGITVIAATTTLLLKLKVSRNKN